MSGGENLLREIYEQPAALRALLAAEAEVSEVGARIAERRRLVRLVAHGPRTTPPRTPSTCSASSRGGTRCATPSRSPSTTRRSSPSRARSWVALSQSGRTPDVVEYVERARRRGALTVALTTCRVAAETLTATDLAHGPVAALDQLYPVSAIASEHASRPAVEAAVARARDVGALVVASGSAAERLEGASHVLRTRRAPLPVLEPILSVLPGQLFASALARAKGLDPDELAHLSKVTLAP